VLRLLVLLLLWWLLPLVLKHSAGAGAAAVWPWGLWCCSGWS
jgi:hypothetical protein